jgi:hypothetical protein
MKIYIKIIKKLVLENKNEISFDKNINDMMVLYMNVLIIFFLLINCQFIFLI